jgi:lon-related putative ATP-dependent protease
MIKEISADEARRVIDPSVFHCETTEELKIVDGIIGQDRAIKSLEFGLSVNRKGFNIFVRGTTGTGRTTAIRRFLEMIAARKEPPFDWCYVHNFDDSYKPKGLKLPAGKGKILKRDMEELVDSVHVSISQAFGSKEYAERRSEITDALAKKRELVTGNFNHKAQSQGFLVQSTPVGIALIPAKDGQPMSDEEWENLGEEEKTTLRQKREKLAKELKDITSELRAEETSTKKELESTDKEVVRYSINHLFDVLRQNYIELPRVTAYFDRVEQDMVENYRQFMEKESESDSPYAIFQEMSKAQSLRKYQVNVLVDNSELMGSPVVLELNPTYQNLVGRIEKEARFGALTTDFTQIKAGSLHRANGGYIALKVEDLLTNFQSWDALKRSIRDSKLEIEDIGERLGFLSTKTLRPEPIELDLKVIVIGEPIFYHLLYRLDLDFKELFKIKADFDTRMEYDKYLRDYVGVICKLRAEENMRHLDSSALAKIIEHSIRLAGDRQKLSAMFADVSDIVREADFWAGEDDGKLITDKHVTKAVEEKVYRSNLVQQRINEMIENGTLIVSTEGETVGQINGLSVLDMGNYMFGKPTRITASIGMGREGLIDIEREAKLGGPIHSKGVMILTGYLASHYTRDVPLSLAARLVFEQSYEEIEGDSASSAELYALLSSLADIPLKQSFSVTGSVNQKGQVQAIGGINEKIEGFYEVCKARGLTGNQGVIIPQSNTRNLMLKDEVAHAISEGKFHVYAVDNIGDGMELLTGLKMGAALAGGGYEQGSINDLIQKRLVKMAKRYASLFRSEPTRDKD